MPYNSAIMGQVIRRRREHLGISQEVLSGLAGIPRSHLSAIENGRKQASQDTLWRLAEGLDTRVSVLFQEVESIIYTPDT